MRSRQNINLGLLVVILGAAGLTARASDVHFEPKEAGLVVRFRIDGVMTDYRVFSAVERDVLLARVKIFGGLDITEKRLPQDGRAALRATLSEQADTVDHTGCARRGS